MAPPHLPRVRSSRYPTPMSPTWGSTLKSSSAPESTKNSKNRGGVNLSHCSISTSRCWLIFTITAPIIMHTSREDRFSISHRPTPASTRAMDRASLLPRLAKNRAPKASTAPSAAPSATLPTISMIGESTMLSTVTAPPSMDWATEAEMEKTIRPRASSMATTGSSICVTGPLALYCRTTISVAAGAVARAMAPRSNARGTSTPKRISPTSTHSAVVSPWKAVMVSGALPIFFK